MAIRKPSQGWVLFALAVTVSVSLIHSLGQVFFFNHTQSMPKGLYIKIPLKKIEIGNIIVFNNKFYNGNLIKYVTAVSKDKYCLDELGVFRVNGITLVQQNINKYYSVISSSVGCFQLKEDELLVLGDHPDSYDSRYFGPIKTEHVIAKVKLLWSPK